jgi:enamine deaminase RidA (YjgF/YER057c/UK114 family)
MNPDIARFPGVPGRSRTVAYGGLLFTVATAATKFPSLREQTADALQVLEGRLREAGSDRTRLLSCTVYITDMARKPEMNEAWLAWVDPDHAPQRACIGAALEGDDLVEIVAVAAGGP